MLLLYALAPVLVYATTNGPALHIPDGFLNLPIGLLCWAGAIALLAVAVRRTQGEFGERQVPLMGVMAAFIFAAQMINFPVAGGTSGHLLGGALAAITLGPWAGMLIMTAVIAVQGLLFQDGGLLVMGWNILNMGVLTAFAGYAGYTLLRRVIGESPRGRLAAAFAGAWLSVEVGAIATAFELAISGTSPLRAALPAMAGVHALIGLGEGIITTGAVGLLEVSRPEVIRAGEEAPGRLGAAFTLGGLSLALIVAVLSPLASSHPDGLEFVAERQGFLGAASEPLFELLPDYTLPIVGNEALTTILAVFLGTLVVFAVAWALGRSAARKEPMGK